MNIPETYHGVVIGLIEKTKNKKVIWNVTTRDDTFVVYFTKFGLSIYQGADEDQNHNYTSISIINNDGKKIDIFWTSDQDDDWSYMDELFNLARRAALSIDKAVEEMISEIEGDNTIGEKGKNGGDEFTDDIKF